VSPAAFRTVSGLCVAQEDFSHRIGPNALRVHNFVV
jgi:hypothetical protein